MVLATVLSIGVVAVTFAQSPDPEQGQIETELATMRAQLTELLDREAIRQLVVSYAHFARTGNVEGLVALYSDDAVFDVPGNMGTKAGPRSGRDAIRETLRVDLPRSDPWPFLHQHVIEILGPDRARGILYFELRQGVDNLRTTHIGSYQDEYVKEQGAWKFRSRRLAALPLHVTAGPDD
ncbi:MAG: nuclear transport factor 2 family protein [Steroidobacteraceae bacterium]